MSDKKIKHIKISPLSNKNRGVFSAFRFSGSGSFRHGKLRVCIELIEIIKESFLFF